MANADQKPNVILINCDDLGYGDLGCYGSRVHNTPFLDQMARDGTRLTDFYMAAPVCSPSRGAMMTGCYPRRVGFGTFDNGAAVLFPGHGTGLHPDETTIGDLLKEQGYATKIVGKWHCGDQPQHLPTKHGFDSYYGLPYSNDMGRQAGGREEGPPLPLLRDDEVIELQPDQSGITERYVEECVRFIRDNKNNPFFLYFAHMHVHLPLYAPERFLDSSENGRYGATVECIDWSVGALMHEIQRLGLEEDTLMIFTSDNGSRVAEGGSNDPLRGRKGQTWDGGMRVPCIARWPGVIPEGQVCSELATAMDMLPTFAGLAGTEPPDDRIIDGHDIFPLFLGGQEASSPYDVFYYYWKDDLEAVRNDRWKLHISRRRDEVVELYDLREDIGETTNVAEDNPEIVRKLMDEVENAREDLGDAVVDEEGANCRPAAFVEDAEVLAEYDPVHPYIIAMYDLPQIG
ncbi:MAG: sulfatase [Planctomycetes bacterium]|nr:sulfatase [Planctomycetota bacterium]